MKITILDSVNIGYVNYTRGQKADVHPVIARTWIKKGKAVGGHRELEPEEEIETQDLENQDAEELGKDASDQAEGAGEGTGDQGDGSGYDVDAEKNGEGMSDEQSIDERVAELREVYTVPELSKIHEELLEKKPHHNAKEETIARAIAEKEKENLDNEA